MLDFILYIKCTEEICTSVGRSWQTFHHQDNEKEKQEKKRLSLGTVCVPNYQSMTHTNLNSVLKRAM